MNPVRDGIYSNIANLVLWARILYYVNWVGAYELTNSPAI